MKKQFFDFLFYFLALSFSKGLALATVFLLVSTVPPSELGAYSLFGGILALLRPILTKNCHVGFSKVSCENSRDETIELLRSIQIGYVARMPVVMIVAFGIDFLFLPDRTAWPLTSLGALLVSTLLLVNIFGRNHSNKPIYLVSDFGRNLLFFCLVWLSQPHGFLTVAMLFLLAGIASNSVSLLYLRLAHKYTPNERKNAKKKIEEIVAISKPTIVNFYVTVLAMHGSKFIIQSFCGSELLGIYSFYMAIGMPSMLLFDSVVMTIQPIYFRSRSKHKKNKLFLISLAPALIGLISSPFLIVVLPRMEHYFPEAYRGYWHIALVIFVAFCMRGGYTLLQIWFVDTNRLGAFRTLNLIAVSINIISTIILIPVTGIIGAAVANLIGFSLLYGLCVIYISVYSKNPTREN